jgi:ribosomal protein S2
MNFIKALFFKNDFFNTLKNKNSCSWHHSLIGVRDSHLIFLNESIFSSYINSIYLLLFFLQQNSNIIVLDSRAAHQDFLWRTLHNCKLVQVITKGFLTNHETVSASYLDKYLKPLLRKPDLIVVFDAASNLDIIKESSSLRIPTICFYNKIRTYSNLYKIANNNSFRLFFFFIYTIKGLLDYRLRYKV